MTFCKSFVFFIIIFFTCTHDNEGASMDNLSSLIRQRHEANNLSRANSRNPTDLSSLLLEIRELLVDSQKTPEEKWQEDFRAFKDEIKSSVNRIQGQLDDLSKSSNQKIDIMLQAFSGVGILATSAEKKLDDLLTRVRIVEKGLRELKRTGGNKLSNVDTSHTHPNNETLEIPLSSHLIMDFFSASIPEFPQTISLADNKFKSTKGNKEILDDPTVPFSLNKTLNKIKTDTNDSNKNLTSQPLLISELHKKGEPIKEDFAQLKFQMPTCSCNEELLKNLFDKTDKELDFLKNNIRSLEGMFNKSTSQTDPNLDPLSFQDELIKKEMSKLEVSLKDGTTNSYVTNITSEIIDLKDKLNLQTLYLDKVKDFLREFNLSKNHLRVPKVKTDLCVWPYLRTAGSCFHVVAKNKRLSWESARQYCKKIQGDLAAPKDFKSFADFLVEEKFSRSYTYWIGGSDLEEEDNWIWVDGQKLPIDSELWATNQPDEGKSSNCMSLKVTSRGINAFDDKCSTANFFICQQEK